MTSETFKAQSAGLVPHLPATYPLLLSAPLAGVFGVCMTLSFAPANAWWFTPFCIAGLFVLLNRQRGLRSWLTGFSFGVGWFSAGFWWIAPGLNNFSEAGPWWSVALTAVLVAYMAVFAATASLAISTLQTRHTDRFRRLLQCLTCAACWTLAEWTRGQLFGGLPWLTTGYSQVPGPGAAFAPVVGVFGLTFISAFVAAALADCFSLAGAKISWRQTAVIPLFTVLTLAAAGYALAKIDWTEDTGRKLTVRLLQGNLSQHDKFTIDGLRRALSTYGDMLQTTTAELTALPETALPIEWTSLPPDLQQSWQMFATERQTAVVLGTIASRPSANGLQHFITNSAIALLPKSSETSERQDIYQYDKHRLIPFGEAMPKDADWLRRQLNLDFASFTRGPPDQPPLVLSSAKVALSICFEDLFDADTASKAKTSEVILNISNFAWFSQTYAPAQHLQIAQMRALETGRWVMSVSNTGITALIDHRGQVQSSLPPDKTAYLDGLVDLYQGSTPFMVVQNVPVITLSIVFILMSAAQRIKRTPIPQSTPFVVTSTNLVT